MSLLPNHVVLGLVSCEALGVRVFYSSPGLLKSCKWMQKLEAERNVLYVYVCVYVYICVVHICVCMRCAYMGASLCISCDDCSEHYCYSSSIVQFHFLVFGYGQYHLAWKQVRVSEEKRASSCAISYLNKFYLTHTSMETLMLNDDVYHCFILLVLQSCVTLLIWTVHTRVFIHMATNKVHF